MNKLKELQEYNLEFLEALDKEEMFGGDYTSAVALKYAKKEIERLNNIINELEKCVQNYIYAIEPRWCSINYNCEYDSEEDYRNAMKEQSKLNAFKLIFDKIKELKESDKE